MILENILDTLNESLPSKLDVWRRNQRKLQMRHPSKTSNVKERLQIAYSLADALEYLHELGIVHRRIHPNFVGFNSIDQLQLHGFGDAIRWTRKVKKSVPQNRYSPSDRIASPASDVYSFSKLLCEIITLCKIQEDGRPKNPLLYVAECHYWSRKLPKSLFECVQRGLSDDIRKRPTMTEMKACIDGALLCMEIQGECAPKDTTNLLKRWRKSFARIKDIDIALPTL
jgi:serine/threonine protein kinase